MVRKRENQPKPTNKIWIFCEGKTELEYFKKLKNDKRIPRIDVKKSKKSNAVGIVNYAISYYKNKKKEFQEKDLIYCVFDGDSHENKHLGEAKKIAENNDVKIIIIFSNPCFEYWLLCHFECFEIRCDARELENRLRNYPEFKGYKKGDEEIYDKTKKQLEKAIEHSKRIIEKHKNDKIELISRESNPSTQVFKVVEEVEKFSD